MGNGGLLRASPKGNSIRVIEEGIVVDVQVRIEGGQYPDGSLGQVLPCHFDTHRINQNDLASARGDDPPTHLLPIDQGTTADKIILHFCL